MTMRPFHFISTCLLTLALAPVAGAGAMSTSGEGPGSSAPASPTIAIPIGGPGAAPVVSGPVSRSPFDDQLRANVEADDAPDQTGDEGTTGQIFDHYDQMLAGATEVARRVQRVCLMMAAALIATGVLLMMYGGFGGGSGPEPARIVAFAMLGVVGIFVWPEIMSRTKELADATAYSIDTFQFDGEHDGLASATVRTFNDMGKGITTAFEKSFFWALIQAPYSQGLFYLGWFLAIAFYVLYRFVWQLGWLFLYIIGPFGMAAACTGTPQGLRIAKGVYMSTLNLACWPIAISVLFALLNRGIHDYAQDPSSIGMKQALISLIIAFSIPMALGFVKVFLSGGGLDTNFAAHASRMTVMATLGALQMAGTLVGAVPGVGGAVGRVAASAGAAMRGMARPGQEMDDAAGSVAGASVSAQASGRVAPMPAPSSRGGTGGTNAGGATSATVGVLAGIGQVGAALGGALARTAYAGAATLGQMAVAAADAGARESGHIHGVSLAPSRSGSRAPVSGTTRATSEPAGSARHSVSSAGALAGVERDSGSDDKANGDEHRSDRGPGGGEQTGSAGGGGSRGTSRPLPTEPVTIQSGHAGGSAAAHGASATRASHGSSAKASERSVGRATPHGAAPGAAVSANLTGAAHTPSLEELGLSTTFGEGAGSEASPVGSARDEAQGHTSSGGLATGAERHVAQPAARASVRIGTPARSSEGSRAPHANAGAVGESADAVFPAPVSGTGQHAHGGAAAPPTGMSNGSLRADSTSGGWNASNAALGASGPSGAAVSGYDGATASNSNRAAASMPAPTVDVVADGDDTGFSVGASTDDSDVYVARDGHGVDTGARAESIEHVMSRASARARGRSGLRTDPADEPRSWQPRTSPHDQ